MRIFSPHATLWRPVKIDQNKHITEKLCQS
jgi:hypothetical protein